MIHDETKIVSCDADDIIVVWFGMYVSGAMSHAHSRNGASDRHVVKLIDIAYVERYTSGWSYVLSSRIL